MSKPQQISLFVLHLLLLMILVCFSLSINTLLKKKWFFLFVLNNDCVFFYLFLVVTLLDYGAGNVRSVRNAIRFLGFEIKDVSFLLYLLMCVWFCRDKNWLWTILFCNWVECKVFIFEEITKLVRSFSKRVLVIMNILTRSLLCQIVLYSY